MKPNQIANRTVAPADMTGNLVRAPEKNLAQRVIALPRCDESIKVTPRLPLHREARAVCAEQSSPM